MMTGVPLRAERLPAALDRLPLADGSVDLVLAHWLVPGPPAVDALLAEVRRALAPGGLFLWTTPGPGTRTEYGETSVLLDMHDLGTALGYAGFVEPVLDIDRFVVDDASQQAARTADGARMDAVIREVIHIAAFSGGAMQQAGTRSDRAKETLVPLAAIGRRDRSRQ
jgi:SAM-dependent methyltransferase